VGKSVNGIGEIYPCVVAAIDWLRAEVLDALEIRSALTSRLQGLASEALVRGRNLRLKYVELHSSSAFSFLERASGPEDLVSSAKELELPAITLVDRDVVYDSPRFHMAAKSVGIRPHVGAEIPCLRIGFRYVRGLKQTAVDKIVLERQMRRFEGIDDLVRRVPELQKAELVTLSEIGALNSLGRGTHRRFKSNKWPSREDLNHRLPGPGPDAPQLFLFL
jgi:hypothetical protein